MEIIPDDGLAGTGPTMNVDRCIERFVTRREPCCASRVTSRELRTGHGPSWGRVGDCRVASDGTTLLSYDQPIARWRDRTLEIECRQFSLATSRHQDAVGWAGRRAGVPSVCRRMAHGATFKDPSLPDAIGPDDPHPAEAWRIERFSRKAKGGGPRKEDLRRAERARAKADALMSDLRRMQRANQRWAGRYYEAAERFTEMVEAMRMVAPRSWEEMKERSGLAPWEDDMPHPEAWTERNERTRQSRLQRIKGRAEWMLARRSQTRR